MQKLILSLLLGLIATGVGAQVETSTSETTLESSEQNTDKDIERVEVTGSLIKRVDVEGPAAVQTFDKEFIEKSGWNSLGDIMRDLSANSFGVAPDQAGNNSPGSQTANLGGLGASRTLVLIDGRRAPRDGALNGFDLSLLPVGAIERFDIMSDAASALYGTDAIGGVINIITKKDFNGFDFSASHFQSEQSGGNRSTTSMTYGASNPKGNFTTSFTVRNNQKIKSSDREVFAIGDSRNSPAANVTYAGADSGPGGNGIIEANSADCLSQENTYVDPATGACRYQFNNIKDETPDLMQVSNVTNFSYDVSSNVSVFGTAMASYKEVEYIYAPGVVAETINGDNYDFGQAPGQDVDIFWRSASFGNRVTNTQETMYGGNFGAKTYLGDTWEVSAIVGADKSERENTNPLGYANKRELLSLIEQRIVDITDNSGTIPDSVRLQPFQRTGSEALFTEVRATGELSDGWAGPIGMALGAGYTYESINIEIDAESAANNVTGGGASQAGRGSRRSQFAVAEVLVPVAKGLEVQAATRFDHFDSFGETINPKLGIAYRPLKSVLLRASAGTGFKAPQMTALFAGSEGYPFFGDHASGFGQYKTLNVSNPDLQPEESVNVSFGTVVEPVQGVSFSVDFIQNRINNMVQSPSLQRINNDERDFGRAFVERKYQVEANRDISGNPLYTVKPINTHEVINRRLQVGFRANKFFDSIGTLSFRNDTSYMLKYTEQFFEDDEAEDIFNLPGNPRWRNNATFTYAPTRGLSFDTGFITTGSSWMNDNVAKFEMYTRIDLAANIGLFNNTASLRLGVQDLTGNTPPFNGFVPNGPIDNVRSLYDYTGTRFFANYRQTF